MAGAPDGSGDSNASPYGRAERWGSCAAHASALIIGIPLSMFLASFPWSLAPCPVFAYMLSRSYRRRRMAWGAFQSMQASVVQLLILLFAAGAASGFFPRFSFLIAALLFLYSLAGALDAFLGYNFRYLGIGRALERVSNVNLGRPEQRRRWFGRGGRDDDARGGKDP